MGKIAYWRLQEQQRARDRVLFPMVTLSTAVVCSLVHYSAEHPPDIKMSALMVVLLTCAVAVTPWALSPRRYALWRTPLLTALKLISCNSRMAPHGATVRGAAVHACELCCVPRCLMNLFTPRSSRFRSCSEDPARAGSQVGKTRGASSWGRASCLFPCPRS